MSKPLVYRFRLFLSTTVVMLLAGCAVSPTGPRAPEAGPVFYPPPPNPPRIQFLTAIAGAEDIDAKQTDFARFILGEDKREVREVLKPYGVAFDDGKLYAVDIDGGGYVVFDLVNRQYYTVRGMRKPINITIDENGNKWVTDTELNQVLLFDRSDQPVRGYGDPGEFKPGDALVIGNRLYVTDLEHHEVKVIDVGTGDVVRIIASAGSDEGQLMFPTNITTNRHQDLYVSDTGNFRVGIFTPEGAYLGKVGEVGTGLGRLARPKGVAVDREDRLYVVDGAFQNVQVFDAERRLLIFFGGAGVGPGEMFLPVDIAINYDAVPYFESYAAPGFTLDYVILVTNQFGPNKINVYGFGKMEGKEYD
jgi:DNA-binding beta-propeller fold protein YncE